MSEIRRYYFPELAPPGETNSEQGWVTFTDHRGEVARLEQSLSDTIHAASKAQGEDRRVMDEQAAEIARLREQVSWLSDSAKVHTNILRGTIALTKAQAIHIAGLPADIEEQVRVLEKVGSCPSFDTDNDESPIGFALRMRDTEPRP